MCAGGAIQGGQTWKDIRLRCTMVRVKCDATSAGAVGEALFCFAFALFCLSWTVSEPCTSLAS